MNTKKRKIIITFIVFMICVTIVLVGQAQAVTSTFNPDRYKPDSTNSVSGATQLETIGNRIIGIIQVIGSAISVIALIVIGIKYVTGSVEEKAEYKETLKPYVIGAVLLFGISNVLGFIQSIISNF